jgi:hypothetical protein
MVSFLFRGIEFLSIAESLKLASLMGLMNEEPSSYGFGRGKGTPLPGSFQKLANRLPPRVCAT